MEPQPKPKKKKKNKNKKKNLSRRIRGFRADPLYPRIVAAVNQILSKGDVVTPIEVLVRMGILRQVQVEEWRRGRIPYLEKVIMGSLPRLSRLLRILKSHATDRGLKPSYTAYMLRKKGRKRPLRFSKTGDRGLEVAYATHFVRGAKKGISPPAGGRKKPSPPTEKPRSHSEARKPRTPLDKKNEKGKE